MWCYPPSEVFGGNPGKDQGVVDFTNLVYSICLEDHRYTGFYFTWSNKRSNQDLFIKKKLDRAIVNQGWLDSFPTANAEFLPQVSLITHLFLFL